VSGRAWLLAAALGAALVSKGCGDRAAPPGRVAVPGRGDAVKTAALLRAGRRAYDGAPPVIPHADFNADCMSCHTREGLAIPDVGFAPPMPHDATAGLSAHSNCRQCHVWRATEETFRENAFEGLRQDLRKGRRSSGPAASSATSPGQRRRSSPGSRQPPPRRGTRRSISLLPARTRPPPRSRQRPPSARPAVAADIGLAFRGGLRESGAAEILRPTARRGQGRPRPPLRGHVSLA
jgi:nitrate reductase cytochrome c-type subunit